MSSGVPAQRSSRAMIHLRHIALLAGFAAVLLSASPGRAAESITVNASVKYQTVIGWEALAQSWEIDKKNNTYDPSWRTSANAIADRMVNELGINRIAMPLSSGWANPVDYWSQFVGHELSYREWRKHSYEKTDPNARQTAQFDFYAETVLMPMKQRLEANGEKLYVNMIFGDFDKGTDSTFAFAQDPEAYAAFVQFYADRLKTKYDVVIDAYTIINEPDNTDGWRGGEIGRALLAVKRRLTAAGYADVNYIAPSATAASNALLYASRMTLVAGAMQALTTLSYHRYQPGDYAKISNYAKSQHLMTDMSEYFPADIDVLFDDLTIGNVSSWQKWSVAGRQGGSLAGYYVADFSNPSAPVYTFAPNVANLALVFRYVRSGAVRIEAQSATMRTMAFVNSDGKQVLFAKRRAGSGSGAVTVTGMQPGTYGVRAIADGSTKAVDRPDIVVAADGSATVPLNPGCTTIYGKRPSHPASPAV